jgi:DNA replication factor GINS
MTAEERDLFETLVENIKTNRTHVMDVLDGSVSAGDAPVDTPPTGTDSAPPETAETKTRDDDSGVSAADVMGAGTSTAGDGDGPASTAETEKTTPPEPPDREVRNDGGGTTPTGSTDVERETVRITADVGDFLGFDEREYDLSENDVVTLPSTNVEPLVARDAAERLD